MVDNTNIIKALSNLNVDTSSLAGETVCTSAVQFYVSRLKQCLEDKCLEAAVAYLKKMRNDSSINASTKLEILHEYQKLS